jgi:Uma2 family endonuclease
MSSRRRFIMQPQRKDEKYTYEDYLSWEGDKRWELVDGVPYEMSFDFDSDGVTALASPSLAHQRVSVELSYQLHGFLKGKPCKLFTAPFDVRLEEDDDDTVFQPDIVVVCDQSKLDEKGCKGAPDFIVEILSASSSSYDKVLKYNKYLQAGVREYWIVDPTDKTVATHFLSGGYYVHKPYGEKDTAPVRALPGCEIILADVFAE